MLSVDFSAIPELWTLVARYETQHGERMRHDTIAAWRHIAEEVATRLNKIPVASLESMLAEAIHALSGERLRKFREEQLHLSDEAAFEGRIRELRAAYGVELRSAQDHPPARLLILHTAEYHLVPYLEGALAAIDAWTFSARSDLRSVFHTAIRWAWIHDPVLARLVCASLIYKDVTHGWVPLTRAYERALTRHRPAAARRAETAAELSRETIGALYWGFSSDARRGAVIRRLMAAAERLGLMPPRPRFERDESARRTTELERLVLDLELSREPAKPTDDLLSLLRGTGP